jgi:transposase
MQDQASFFLLEFDRLFPNCDAFVVFDNSSGHDCYAKDSLRATKLNKYPGHSRKEGVTIRDGYFYRNDNKVIQSMWFQPGDVLLVDINVNHSLDVGKKAKNVYRVGYVVKQKDELIGVLKGSMQVLNERGVAFTCQACLKDKKRTELNKHAKEVKENFFQKNDDESLHQLMSLPTSFEIADIISEISCDCSTCVLAQQEDFSSQKNGLEEVFLKHNKQYGTNHICKLLPKFHPELNPIERCWSRLKAYIRKFNDGTLDTLKRLMVEGAKECNIPLCLIRKYIRLSEAYLIAYENGLNILQTTEWLKKHRSHRAHSEKMDDTLEQLYFPERYCSSNSSSSSTSQSSTALSDATAEHGMEPWSASAVCDEDVIDVSIPAMDIEGAVVDEMESMNESDEREFQDFLVSEILSTYGHNKNLSELLMTCED